MFSKNKPAPKAAERAHINGLHGTKALWRVRKMDELDALAVTIERLMA